MGSRETDGRCRSRVIRGVVVPPCRDMGRCKLGPGGKWLYDFLLYCEICGVCSADLYCVSF
jgi:hypothetical protein